MDDGSNTPGFDRALLRAEQEAQERHRQVIERVGEIARATVLEYLQNCPQARDIRSWVEKVEARGEERMTKLEEAVGQIRVSQGEQLGATKAYVRLMALATVVVAAGSLLMQWLKT